MTNDDWLPVAHRGQLDLTVMTRAHAEFKGMCLPAEANYCGIVRPDGGDDCPVGFISMSALRVFIDEMQPRSVHIVPDEDRSLLEAELSRRHSDLLH